MKLTLDLKTGTPTEPGRYIVVRYRKPHGTFLDITTHRWNGKEWLVGPYNNQFIDIRYWCKKPGDPERRKNNETVATD